MTNKKKLISFIIMLVLVPAAVITGTLSVKGHTLLWLCAVIAVLSAVPFFIMFEKGKTDVRELTIIAVMTAFGAAGRLIFAELPGFKPVAAIVIITAIYFGCEAGFMTGSLVAVISNIYFGQGAWTLFQMFGWGFTGFAAGILKKPLKKHLWVQLVFGAAAGFVYSGIMDVYTTLFLDKSFSLTRFFAIAATSLPSTITYAASNVVFLLLLSRPIGNKLMRLKTKYNVGAGD